MLLIGESEMKPVKSSQFDVSEYVKVSPLTSLIVTTALGIGFPVKSVEKNIPPIASGSEPWKVIVTACPW